MPALDRHAGGAIIFTGQLNLINFTLTMAQDLWTLQGKEVKKSQKPAHGPPLQARVVAANRTVLAAYDDPGAHGNEQGGEIKTEPGGKLMRAVGMAWQRRAGTHSLQN